MKPVFMSVLFTAPTVKRSTGGELIPTAFLQYCPVLLFILVLKPL